MTEFSLTKPPLLCVVARVQILRVESLANFIPTLQEALRLDGYPLSESPIKTKNWKIEEIQGSGMNVGYEEVERWEFSNAEKTVIIRLDIGSVSILFTDYDHFSHAEPHYRRILSMIEEAIPSLQATSFQLRYVGYIPCEHDSDPSEWVTASVLGMPNLGDLQRSRSISETHFETPDGGQMVTRCMSMGSRNLTIPPDLFPLRATLRYPEISPVPFLLLENVHHRKIDPTPFTSASCLAQISALRLYNSQVFQATVMPKALESWR